jgi:ribosomal protein S12 methylthiotransferase accessory factor
MSTADVLDLDFSSREGAGLLDAVAHRHGTAITRIADHLSRTFLLRSAWAPGLCFVGAQAEIQYEATQKAENFSFGGCGLSLEDATISCLGEAAERISQIERRRDIARTATLAEVAEHVPPQVSALAHHLLELSSRGDGTPLDWVAARNLAGREVLLPADWCLRRAQPGPLKVPGAALSVGCAAGPTAESASARALLEAVERDAVSLWWKGGRRGAALDAATTENAVRLIDRLRGGDAARRTSLLDVTTDLAIPVVVAFSTDAARSGFAAGFGCRFSLGEAAAAALVELCQMELGLQIAMLKRDRLGANSLTAGDAGHLARGAGVHVADDARFRTVQRTDVGAAFTRDMSGIRQALERHEIEAALMELTRADIGVPVVKSVVPALQQLPSDIETQRLRSSRTTNAATLPVDAIELT